MTDRVHPSSKPQAGGGGVPAAAANPAAAPGPKSQLYNPNRLPYRPDSRRRRSRSRRSCFCHCCICGTLLILLVLLIAATACAAAYLLYRPRRPDFTVVAVRISRFNLSSTPDSGTSHLAANLSLAVSAHNPNSKVTFSYDPFAVSVLSAGVLIGNTSFPAFTHLEKNSTLIKTVITSSQDLDAESFTALQSDLKKKNSLAMEVHLDTKVMVKIGGLKSNKVGIRVSCIDIRGIPPKGKSPAAASTSNSKCEVDLRVKIWKFTF
ncbi:NDR1/HIN1-like protein 6 [Malania oleifera]|uniref:NDR1/HIN1-like protein 6 n=1 Tax=Malania oleifera TaxID=397392 RepID=UPI0025AE0118|nr:NDR1/HIN1-like protein 6 [Malania oleifera]XP_057957921.1 NDR1/HIN1-like protein 6 [Malania oleifera]XP_057957922.1 NDR1/HIN1-like protein 6 [Malania oleifera]XP_057957923.1 NDR1/HIN1-like protein 6 [Malania oleifera]